MKMDTAPKDGSVEGNMYHTYVVPVYVGISPETLRKSTVNAENVIKLIV